MNRLPVESTFIVAAGYDEPSETMEIEFASGAIYQYYEVPPQIYGEFEQSESKGQFFRAHLLDRYRYSEAV